MQKLRVYVFDYTVFVCSSLWEHLGENVVDSLFCMLVFVDIERLLLSRFYRRLLLF